MDIQIIYPSRSHSGYKIACDIFSEMAKKVAGVEAVKEGNFFVAKFPTQKGGEYKIESLN